MTPSIGRIVHYQVAAKEVLPAIVLAVNEGPQYTTVDLEVFGMLPPEPGTSESEVQTSLDARFPANVYAGEPGEVGRWFWPPRSP